ncbi:TIM barrel protein [Chloroflexota bacterium]
MGGRERAKGILFGTAGIPRSSPEPTSWGGIQRVKELGLGCMELEFVYGVRMNNQTALMVHETALRHDIKLSAHCPYYINLNSRKPGTVESSRRQIIKTGQIAFQCGATSITFHAAFYMGDTPEKVYRVVRDNLIQVMGVLKEENINLWIRPEISGKTGSFGTLDEILGLSSEIPGIAPCIDFSHWYARQTGFNTYPEFSGLLKKVERKLGTASLESMHLHVSGIQYGKSGENKHLNLKESNFNYIELLQALIDNGCSGLLICESPNLEDDALLLQETYHKLS